jgi:hypothetical protein
MKDADRFSLAMRQIGRPAFPFRKFLLPKKPQKPSFGDELVTHSCPGMDTDFQPSW